MLKAALVGVGAMGRGHLEKYLKKMEEGKVCLTALCDVDPKKLGAQFSGGNMGDLGQKAYDMGRFHLYTDFDEMLDNEEVDYVDIALPTYLHSYYTVKALDRGLNVICEKPMALNPEQCTLMIDAAARSGKKLMIAQCLRFWPAYETLKRFVDSGELGAPVSFFFYRGGGTPMWSFQDWLRDEARSGGCLLDQHVHDVDTINYLFGLPAAVSCIGRNVFPGAGFDAVSTNYRYDGFIVNSQDDWSLNGTGEQFEMLFRANFEKGSVRFQNGVCTIHPVGAPARRAEDFGGEDGYSRELDYFIRAVKEDLPVETADPESTRLTICLATAERESARRGGEWVKIET